MAWSYDNALPTSRDRVRFRIGDIDTDRQLLANETIDALLATYGDSVLRVSVISVRSILALFARDVDRSVMGISGSVDEVTQHYRALLLDLENEQTVEAGVYPGAISIATRTALDTQNGGTYIAPDFKLGMFDMFNSSGS